MADVIVIGTQGDTRAYATAGLTCFEPERGHLVERVLAERGRCGVLAITRAAYDALPAALAKTLCGSVWPTLAIVPVMRDAGAASRAADRLMRIVAARRPVAA